MRLISHNLLQCNRKNCDKSNFPLAIQVVKALQQPCEFKKEALLRLVQKLDWPALHATITLLGEKNFPKECSQGLLEDESFLKQLHIYILETHILEGSLQCNNCGTHYPIVNGIPNMILQDEDY